MGCNALADGRVSAWEEETFATLVRRDALLSDVQKRKVLQLLRDWSARDRLQEPPLP